MLMKTTIDTSERPVHELVYDLKAPLHGVLISSMVDPSRALNMHMGDRPSPLLCAALHRSQIHTSDPGLLGLVLEYVHTGAGTEATDRSPLSEAIGSHTTIPSLDLSGSVSEAQDITICGSLKHLTNLQKLNLTEAKIPWDSGSADTWRISKLARALRQLPSLQSLGLSFGIFRHSAEEACHMFLQVRSPVYVLGLPHYPCMCSRSLCISTCPRATC